MMLQFDKYSVLWEKRVEAQPAFRVFTRQRLLILPLDKSTSGKVPV